MAQAQLSDSEGSHSADSMLEGTAEAATQPKGTGLSQEAGKTWLSLPAKRCQQRCVPLDAMSEGPEPKLLSPGLARSSLAVCLPMGTPIWVLGKAFPNQSVLVSTPGRIHFITQ